MDPLAGQREKVNSGEKKRLVFPDRGRGCPVELGQVIPLRSCSIEITEIKRKQIQGEWRFEAEFTRYLSGGDRVHIPDRRGGYTSDPRAALSSGEERPEPAAGDPKRIGPPPENQSPPEPEAVPPHEVAQLSGTQQAAVAHEHELAEARRRFDEQPVAVQLAQLSELAKRRHVDISSDERVVRQRLERMKDKVLKAA